MPATTLAGVQLKARVAERAYTVEFSPKVTITELIDRVREADGPASPQAAALSLVRDLLPLTAGA